MQIKIKLNKIMFEIKLKNKKRKKVININKVFK